MSGDNHYTTKPQVFHVVRKHQYDTAINVVEEVNVMYSRVLYCYTVFSVRILRFKSFYLHIFHITYELDKKKKLL